MNKLFDLVSIWANKLTHRALIMSGTSEEAVNNWKNAVDGNEQNINNFDNELNKKAGYIKTAIIFIFLVMGIYLIDRLILQRR
jgi:hypothetical protein